jgi:hypothetical protein
MLSVAYEILNFNINSYGVIETIQIAARRAMPFSLVRFFWASKRNERKQ